MSYRQIKRLWRRLEAGRGESLAACGGRACLESPNGAAAPPASAGADREKYSGDLATRFGPTLIAEHLASEDGLRVDHEKARRWMLAAGLWSRQRRRALSSPGPYTTGHGVNGFTYEPSLGEYFLSHPNMKMPEDGKIYSINEGLANSFPQPVRDYIQYCKDKTYTARYIGSLVADFHRNLLKGGVYVYPATAKFPNGKLRLMYECNALAFVAEQAGGKATDGKGRILDIQLNELHQRTAFYVGSKNMVEKAESFG